MADVAALSASVLLRVAELLKTLPADQLEDLAAGTAKLEVVPKGGRAASRNAATPSTVDIAEVRRMLGSFTSVADAARYLDGLGLKLPERKALAADLGVTLVGRATLASVRDAIVKAYVGDLLNSEAIRRQAAGH